jgi:hypothetical protein
MISILKRALSYLDVVAPSKSLDPQIVYEYSLTMPIETAFENAGLNKNNRHRSIIKQLIKANILNVRDFFSKSDLELLQFDYQSPTKLYHINRIKYSLLKILPILPEEPELQSSTADFDRGHAKVEERHDVIISDPRDVIGIIVPDGQPSKPDDDYYNRGIVKDGLVLYQDYSREELHDVFSPNTPYRAGSGSWGISGIITVPERQGDFIFMVTHGSSQAGHEFNEPVTENGVITWQSKPYQQLRHPQIQQLIKHNELTNSIYLFLRTQTQSKYTYLGTLQYLSHDHDRENPVHIKWQIMNWNIDQNTLTRIGLNLASEKQNNSVISRVKAFDSQLNNPKPVPIPRTFNQLSDKAMDTLEVPHTRLSTIKDALRNIDPHQIDAPLTTMPKELEDMSIRLAFKREGLQKMQPTLDKFLRMGILTVGDFFRKDDLELLKVPYLGITKLSTIKDALRNINPNQIDAPLTTMPKELKDMSIRLAYKRAGLMITPLRLTLDRLIDVGIDSVGDFFGKDDWELLEIPHLGVTKLSAIKDALLSIDANQTDQNTHFAPTSLALIGDEDGDPKDVIEFICKLIAPTKGNTESSYRSTVPETTLSRRVDVFINRFVFEETLEEIGQKYGITRERIRQIALKITKALEKLSTGHQQLLFNRLGWVETSIKDSIQTEDKSTVIYDPLAIHSLEAKLGWPNGSIATWIAISGLTGFSSQNSGNSPGINYKSNYMVNQDNLLNGIGSLRFYDGHLLDTETLGISASKESINAKVEEIIGPAKIMLMNDFFRTLDRIEGNVNSNKNDYMARAKSLEMLGSLNILEASYVDELYSGIWVTSGLNHEIMEICKAVLYSGWSNIEDASSIGKDYAHLKEGVRIELVADWLLNNSTYKPTLHAIQERSKRYTTIFNISTTSKIGLVAAGALGTGLIKTLPSADAFIYNALIELSTTQPIIRIESIQAVVKSYYSNVTIYKNIKENLSLGNIINLNNVSGSKSTKWIHPSHRYNLRINPNLEFDSKVVKAYIAEYKTRPVAQQHGNILKLMREVIEKEPDGLTDLQIVTRVRDNAPNTSINSINWYLKRKIKEFFYIGEDDKYRPVEKSTVEPDSKYKHLTTIGILRRVLSDATYPLTHEEIVERCNKYKNVRPDAILTYLSNNYRQLFIKHKNNTYSLA